MPMFPTIDSPCPYKDRLASVMDGDFCRMCRREVHDLTAMTDDERQAFLAACEGKVCVSYRVPLRGALVAAAIAGSVAALPAAAMPAEGGTTESAAITLAGLDVMDQIIVGGIKNPKRPKMVEHAAADAAIPELPVVVEEAPAATSVAATKRAAPHS